MESCFCLVFLGGLDLIARKKNTFATMTPSGLKGGQLPLAVVVRIPARLQNKLKTPAAGRCS